MTDIAQEAPVSYFGQPLLKKPHWGRNVVTYLFLGGIMGGSGMLVLLAGGSANPNDRKLARNAKYASLALAAACPPILISHLGRPERFLNMLRVVKFRSPMSLGVWGLIAFSAVAGANAAAEFFGRRTRVFDVPQGLLGAFLTGYTGVLLSATAIPIWAKGKYHIPAMCVCSGVAGACALHALLLSVEHAPDTLARVDRMGALAGIAEAAIVLDFRQHAGDYGKPMYEGARGTAFRNVTLLAGVAAPLLLNLPSLIRKSNVHSKSSAYKTLLAAGLELVGGYMLRWTLIEAGKASADDPLVAFRQPE